ncbi:O-antigen ligase family protein [Motilimonas eburnea]|uniref:O-antigen ligase family protein n=1 Tax=Motilimonas eburnea TaxID=1737488 RepID=UPI001E4542E2|nr:O-antigen ligase family protein [Motilimonas eburnea]MCE2572043.1 O-antigen ligase family protein [Motilimonas eburnea]
MPSNPHLTNSKRWQVTLACLCCAVLAMIWWFAPHPLMAVALAIAPLAALFVLNVPFFMVVLFVAFSFFRLHEVFPALYNLKIPLMLSLGAIAALAWHLLVSQQIRPFWTKELSVISVFFVLVMIGVVFAGNRPVAIAYFNNIYWKIALMTFAIAWLTREAKHFSFACHVNVISGLLVAIVALNNKANGIGLVEETRVTIGRELGSVLGDPNDLALVMMFPAAFATSLFVSPNMSKTSKLLGLIALITIFCAVIATQSRGGLLGIVAVLAVFGYRYIKSKALLGAIGAIGLLLLYVVAGISDRASGGAAESGVDESAMGRLYAWEAAFNMALDHPILGMGLDNFYYNYYYYSPHWDGLNHAVHSTWFGVLAETGFVGLGVFVYMIVVMIRSSLHSLALIQQQLDTVPPAIFASAQAIFAGLLGTVVSGTFLTQGFTWPIYILVALVAAMSQWCRCHLPQEANQ